MKFCVMVITDKTTYLSAPVEADREYEAREKLINEVPRGEKLKRALSIEIAKMNSVNYEVS